MLTRGRRDGDCGFARTHRKSNLDVANLKGRNEKVKAGVLCIAVIYFNYHRHASNRQNTAPVLFCGVSSLYERYKQCYSKDYKSY